MTDAQVEVICVTVVLLALIAFFAWAMTNQGGDE